MMGKELKKIIIDIPDEDALLEGNISACVEKASLLYRRTKC